MEEVRSGILKIPKCLMVEEVKIDEPMYDPGGAEGEIQENGGVVKEEMMKNLRCSEEMASEVKRKVEEILLKDGMIREGGYKRDRPNLYELNEEEYPEGSQKRRRIQKAKMSWRFHQKRKGRIADLEEENLRLRELVSRMRGKLEVVETCQSCENLVGGEILEEVDAQIAKFSEEGKIEKITAVKKEVTLEGVKMEVDLETVKKEVDLETVKMERDLVTVKKEVDLGTVKKEVTLETVKMEMDLETIKKEPEEAPSARVSVSKAASKPWLGRPKGSSKKKRNLETYSPPKFERLTIDTLARIALGLNNQTRVGLPDLLTNTPRATMTRPPPLVFYGGLRAADNYRVVSSSDGVQVMKIQEGQDLVPKPLLNEQLSPPPLKVFMKITDLASATVELPTGQIKEDSIKPEMDTDPSKVDRLTMGK